MEKNKMRVTRRLNLSTILFILVILVSLTGLANAAEDANMTIEEKATLCINDSLGYVNQLQSEGFNIIRLNDTYEEAFNLYSAQLILKERAKTHNFDIILPYCEDIKKLYNSAMDYRDQIIALNKFYNSSLTSDMNASSVDATLNEINAEMKSERYENIGPLIDKAYNQIIDVKSSHTTLKLFYESTTQGITQFFTNNWKVIIVVIVISVILLSIFRIRILRWHTRRKIEALEMRKRTIKELIIKTQKEYFEKGTLPEGTYNIRTKKFAELMRDIERQVPLLQEELAKLERRKK